MLFSVKRKFDDRRAKLLRCSFCGLGKDKVGKLISGPGVYICDACVELCSRIIAEEGARAE